ncbi:hypothetical protein BH24BAC1_BH24BAC1_32290 [soil metagenome]
MSTAVVMAGLAATAGSPPSHRTSIGSEAPMRVADTACKVKASDIVKATSPKVYPAGRSDSYDRNYTLP